MLSEVNNLRDELHSLMEVQQQIMHYRDGSSLVENSQNAIRNVNLTLNMNNNNNYNYIHNSNQQINILEEENVKNSKNKSYDNKNEKSNIYLPTCETYRKTDMTMDGILFCFNLILFKKLFSSLY